MEEKEYNETPEERAEQEALEKWWNDHIPRKYITMVNPHEYVSAKRAIKYLIELFSKKLESWKTVAESEDASEFDLDYKIRFDEMFGTNLGFYMYIHPLGFNIYADELTEIYNYLHQTDCIINICAGKADDKIEIGITFRNIKDLVAHEETKEPLDLPDGFFDDLRF